MLSLSMLHSIRAAMPHLIMLACSVDPTSEPPLAAEASSSAACFGAQLECIILALVFPHSDPAVQSNRWQQISTLVRAAAECTRLQQLSLVNRRSLCCSRSLDSQLPFASSSFVRWKTHQSPGDGSTLT